MKFNLNKILSEWAYRVDDGQPNVSNADHINHLREVLYNFGLPHAFIVEYVHGLTETQTYVDNSQNRSLNRVGKEWGTAGKSTPVSKAAQDIDSVDQEAPDTNPSADSKEVTSTVIIPISEPVTKKAKQAQSTKEEFILTTIEAMEENLSQGRQSGVAGEFSFRTQEEAEQMKDFYNRNKEHFKNTGNHLRAPKIYKVAEGDIDNIINALETTGRDRNPPDAGYLTSKIDSKGALSGGAKAYGWEDTETRRRALIKDYLETGGISVITGKRVPFSEMQLDHITSLSLGGTDNPDNWHWMESRFNQQKSALEGTDLMDKIQKVIDMDPTKFSIKQKQAEIQNLKKVSFKQLFANKFKQGSNAGLTEENLDTYSTDELEYIAYGINEAHGLKSKDDEDPMAKVKTYSSKLDKNKNSTTYGMVANRGDDFNPKSINKHILSKLRDGKSLSDGEQKQYDAERSTWGVKYDRATKTNDGNPEFEDQTEMVTYKGKMYPKGWVAAKLQFKKNRTGGVSIGKDKIITNIIDGCKRMGHPLTTSQQADMVDAEVQALKDKIAARTADIDKLKN
jgi:hypothetical protein